MKNLELKKLKKLFISNAPLIFVILLIFVIFMLFNKKKETLQISANWRKTNLGISNRRQSASLRSAALRAKRDAKAKAAAIAMKKAKAKAMEMEKAKAKEMEMEMGMEMGMEKAKAKGLEMAMGMGMKKAKAKAMEMAMGMKEDDSCPERCINPGEILPFCKDSEIKDVPKISLPPPPPRRRSVVGRPLRGRGEENGDPGKTRSPWDF